MKRLFSLSGCKHLSLIMPDLQNIYSCVLGRWRPNDRNGIARLGARPRATLPDFLSISLARRTSRPYVPLRPTVGRCRSSPRIRRPTPAARSSRPLAPGSRPPRPAEYAPSRLAASSYSIDTTSFMLNRGAHRAARSSHAPTHPTIGAASLCAVQPLLPLPICRPSRAIMSGGAIRSGNRAWAWPGCGGSEGEGGGVRAVEL